MSSNGYLYGVKPRGAQGESLVSLSDIPQKLDMTNPANQRKAQGAWAEYRARLNQPGSAQQNMKRATNALHERFYGFPNDALFGRITDNEGLDHGQTDIQQFDPEHWTPRDAVERAGKKALLERTSATISPAQMTDKGPMISPWSQGDEPQSTTYFRSDTPQSMLPGLLAHEAIHAWAHAKYPGWRTAADDGSLNKFGEEPAPHFPEGYHDRGLVEGLEGGNLATKYGGYPNDVKRQSPWPMVRGMR